MLAALVLGVGLMFCPEQFFGSANYEAVIGRIANPFWWGVAYAITGTIIGAGIFKAPFRIAQAGLMLFSIITFSWGLGLLVIPLTSPTVAYTGATIWLLIAVRTFVLALEPPINPATAVHIDQESEEV